MHRWNTSVPWNNANSARIKETLLSHEITSLGQSDTPYWLLCGLSLTKIIRRGTSQDSPLAHTEENLQLGNSLQTMFISNFKDDLLENHQKWFVEMVMPADQHDPLRQASIKTLLRLRVFKYILSYLIHKWLNISYYKQSSQPLTAFFSCYLRLHRNDHWTIGGD